ncbi:hypothetical protein HQ563_00755 [bacterium]|nr:hypothetical protein [bacterium]
MAVKAGINTDNWRLENRPLEFCVRRTAELGVKRIQFDTLLGFDFIEGLGFSPAVSLDTDPFALRDLLEQNDHPLLKVNFDTGNSFICGHDPMEFLKAVVDIKASEPGGLCSKEGFTGAPVESIARG